MTQPIIGLTTCGRNERPGLANEYYDEFYYIPADYVDAVRRAGGVPILLPPGETNWQRWLDATDGIIVIGGADIHPQEYGGNAEHPNLTRLDVERDGSEIRLTRKLMDDADQPTLFICRGMQVLNVALGGTLHEHVPDIMEEDIHRNEAGFWADQPLTADSDSKLANVMGATDVTTTSGHHQAIKDVAAGLKVTAAAADGIIEALEVSDHPWALAVQWHPEKTAAVDPTQQALFDQLVEAARDKRAKKSIKQTAGLNEEPLTKEAMNTYQEQWALVAEMQKKELREMTSEKRWQKLNAITQLSIAAGIFEKMRNAKNADAEGVNEVRNRWNRLRELYK